MLSRFVILAGLVWGTQASADTPTPPPASPAPAPEYDIAINHSPDIVIANAPATLSVTITPHAPWLLKITTPFNLAFQGAQSVEFKQNKFSARDFADPKASAKLVSSSFIAKEAGEQHVSVDMMFFLCSDQVCQRHKEVREHVFAVNPTP